MNMLTGMFPSSSGLALINDMDINDDMVSIRKQMGFCPQHDVLFDDLTVYEHLELFGRLKGVRIADLHRSVMIAMDEVQLTSKLHAKSSELSGGQKRRLSLAISLIGDSKIVFLDGWLRLQYNSIIFCIFFLLNRFSCSIATLLTCSVL